MGVSMVGESPCIYEYVWSCTQVTCYGFESDFDKRTCNWTALTCLWPKVLDR